jgi:hypothetical protein
VFNGILRLPSSLLPFINIREHRRMFANSSEGIDAPREVQILRKELFDAVQDQDRLATKLATIPEPDSIKKLRDLLIESAKPDGTPPTPTKKE